MLSRLFHLISAERTSPNQKAFLPTFYQHQAVYEFCKRYVKEKKVIEIGCGTGFGAYELSKLAKKYVALDKDKFVISENRNKFRNKNLQFIALDLKKLSSKDTYDIVISLQVIEHFENVGEYLDKIYSLLKHGGLLILSTPNSTTQSYNENPYHYKEYTEKELYVLLNSYFKNVKIFGLHGDKIVKAYENQRKEKVLLTLSKDILQIRKLFPRKIRQWLFDIGAMINRSRIAKKNFHLQSISKKNYTIKSNTKNAIDLLVVAYK